MRQGQENFVSQLLIYRVAESLRLDRQLAWVFLKNMFQSTFTRDSAEIKLSTVTNHPRNFFEGHQAEIKLPDGYKSMIVKPRRSTGVFAHLSEIQIKFVKSEDSIVMHLNIIPEFVYRGLALVFLTITALSALKEFGVVFPIILALSFYFIAFKKARALKQLLGSSLGPNWQS